MSTSHSPHSAVPAALDTTSAPLRPDRGLLPLMRRHWIIIIAVTLLSAVVGLWAGGESTEVYEARSRVIVGPYQSDLDTIRASSSLVQTYAGLATSDTITDAVAAQYGATKLDDVVEEVRVTGNEVTRIIIIRVTALDPQTAADVANSIASEMAAVTADAELVTGQVQLIDAAEVPSGPVESGTTLYGIIGALVGLIAAIALAVLLERISKKVRHADDIDYLTGLPVLASVTLDRRPASRADRLASLAGEDGASLRFAVEQVMSPGEPRLLALVPIGDTALMAPFAADFGLSMASSGRAVLVLSADRPGDAWTSEPLMTVLAHADARPLDIASGELMTRSVDVSGPMAATPAEIAQALRAAVKGDAGIVVDLGAIDRSAAALSVASVADSVVFVVELRHARRKDLVEAVSILSRSGAPLAGVITVDEAHAHEAQRARSARLVAANEAPES